MARIVIEKDKFGQDIAKIEGTNWMDDGSRERKTLRDANFYNDQVNNEWRRKR